MPMKRSEALEIIGRKLVSGRRELAAEVADPANKLASAHGGTAFDAMVVEEQAAILELRDRNLHAADDAIAEVRNGTYGICKMCDQSIPLERLQAMPTATHCITCQREAERDEANGRAALSKDWESVRGGDDHADDSMSLRSIL